MSVRTPADEKLDEAMVCLREAIKSLGEVVVEERSGWGDYERHYQGSLRGALSDLIDVRDRIER